MLRSGNTVFEPSVLLSPKVFQIQSPELLATPALSWKNSGVALRPSISSRNRRAESVVPNNLQASHRSSPVQRPSVVSQTLCLQLRIRPSNQKRSEPIRPDSLTVALSRSVS